MSRPSNRLTDTQIKAEKPKDKEFSLGDGNGLSLRIKPNGSKLWIFNYYRPFTKKRANLSFGLYPDVTLKQARTKAKDAKSLVANDIDPKQESDRIQTQEKNKHENTLEAMTKKWLELKKVTVSEKHYLKIKRNIEVKILSNIGQIPIHLIEPQIVIKQLKPIANEGKLDTVKRTCQQVNEIMAYCVNSGVIKFNPLINITKTFNTPKKVNLPTLKPEEISGFMRTLQFAQIKLVTRFLIEWQLHTITRPSEAAGARWEEIDTHQKTWTIPASRMKMNKEHIIPLTPQALNLLANIKSISGHREYIFPSQINPKSHMNSATANVAIKRMGFQGRLVAHGLRSLASTTLNEEGFDPDVIESALAHTDKNRVRAAYNRAEYLNPRRKMMEWWSQHIVDASTGNLSLAVTN